MGHNRVRADSARARRPLPPAAAMAMFGPGGSSTTEAGAGTQIEVQFCTDAQIGPPSARTPLAPTPTTVTAVEPTRAKAFTLVVDAPAGKLGLVFALDKEHKQPFVKRLHDGSPMDGRVIVGDILLMLDDEDVSSLSHRQICQAVLAKNDRARTLTLLRQPAPADEANPIALETTATEVKDNEPEAAPTDVLLF